MENGYIYVGENVFSTLLAISAEEQERGLMYIDPPLPIMSFVYSDPQITKFWMSNTKAPLDIVFCYKGEVTQICKGEPYSTSVIGGDYPSDLVIEFPIGTVENTKIKLGHKAGIIKPTPLELKKNIAQKCHTFVKI